VPFGEQAGKTKGKTKNSKTIFLTCIFYVTIEWSWLSTECSLASAQEFAQDLFVDR
jgi:hypothetical protein